MSAPIVVGYDGSPSSTDALDWAATEASLRKRPLRIVHVASTPVGTVTGFGIYAAPDADLLVHIGEQTLAAAVQRVEEQHPEIETDGRLVVGQPSRGLLDNLTGAEMAVVGQRGLSEFKELLLGSTGFVLATHAHCPVVVVRPSTVAAGEEAGRVVVGVDGSESSMLALGFAFDEASVRQCGLTALHSWEATFYEVRGRGGPLTRQLVDEFQGDELRLLAESLAGWREKYPDVDVRQVLHHGEAVENLVAASAGASLLALGSRGRGGFRSLVLGSTSHALLHHAQCPVAVIPAAHS
ncbi:MAG TPA: universal stress protein [Actinomycetes bacterium]|nr:universal stress protein [Actinomycetes bacterium]